MGDRSATTTSALVKALSGASFGLGLSELVAPGYEIFKNKEDRCTKVVLNPS